MPANRIKKNHAGHEIEATKTCCVRKGSRDQLGIHLFIMNLYLFLVDYVNYGY